MPDCKSAQTACSRLELQPKFSTPISARQSAYSGRLGTQLRRST
jgi:hypothetical protein